MSDVRKLCEALAELASLASYCEAAVKAGGTPDSYEAFVIYDGTRGGFITAAANYLEVAPAAAVVSLAVGEERIVIGKGPLCQQ